MVREAEHPIGRRRSVQHPTSAASPQKGDTMSDPRSYPEDQGPFDAAAEAPDDEKVFTADDGADDDGDGLDPLEQGDEANVDPDLGLSNDAD
jgi:hypothetical protein